MDYFEFYHAYLAQCEKENWANMRDPNHDYMEWNHTLPQCIFEDQPIGQWLTIEQHAIASALQTLAFRRNCMCGWHFGAIPEKLFNLAKPYYSEQGRKSAQSWSFEQRSAAGKVGGKKAWQVCKERGVGLFDPGNRGKGGKKVGRRNVESGHLARISISGGLASGSAKWMDPLHPELGSHHHITLMKIQRDKGYPHGKENRVRVQ
jgi:hypothetical protein